MPRAFLFSSKRYGLVRKSVPSCGGFESALIPSGKVSPKCSPCTGSSEVALNLSCSQVALKQPVEPSLPVTAPPVQPIFDSAQVSATYAHTSPASQSRPRRKRLQPSLISASPDSGVSDPKTLRPIRTKRTKRKLVEDGDFAVSEEPELKDGPKEEHQESSSYDTGSSESHFACPECGKVYTTASNLTRHRQTHRSLSDQKARKCPHCDRVYVSSPAYNMHVQTHLQSCECPHCKKRFSRQWLLQGHLRTHSGERPFQCHKCEKNFADKSNLRAHIQTHSNEKPFVCQTCQKAFALKSYLTKHEEASCNKNKKKSLLGS